MHGNLCGNPSLVYPQPRTIRLEQNNSYHMAVSQALGILCPAMAARPNVTLTSEAVKGLAERSDQLAMILDGLLKAIIQFRPCARPFHFFYYAPDTLEVLEQRLRLLMESCGGF
jgi:hypothetical protein